MQEVRIVPFKAYVQYVKLPRKKAVSILDQTIRYYERHPERLHISKGGDDNEAVSASSGRTS